MLKTIYLHGPLAERFGGLPFVFQADNFRQLMSGMRVHCPGFETELRKYSSLCILKKRDNQIESVPQEELTINFGAWDELHLNVAVTGAGAETFAAWAVSSTVGTASAYAGIVYAAAYIVYAVAISYAMSAVVQSMQDTISTESAKAESKSSLFNGPENRVRQGARVQLNYGRFRVGSVTLNQKMTAVRQSLTKADNLSLDVSTSGSVNVFDNDLFTVSPVAASILVNGVTTAAGTVYNYAAVGCTVVVTAAGVLTVTAGAGTATFSVVVNATDGTQTINQTVSVSVSQPQQQYYYDTGGPGATDGAGGAPGGDGGDGGDGGAGGAGAGE